MVFICAGKEWQASKDQLKSYGLAMIALNLCIILPISGMNSALDTLVSRAAGSMHSNPKTKKLRDLIWTYLMHAVICTTAVFSIMACVLSLAKYGWRFLPQDQPNKQPFLDKAIIEDA